MTKDNAKYVAGRFQSYRRRYDVDWSFYQDENQNIGAKTMLSDGMKRFLDALVDDMVRNVLKEYETSNGGIAK